MRLTNIASITASTIKFINNLSTENTWIRIFVQKYLRNLSLVKTSLTLAFLKNLFQRFSIFLCATLEYIPMKESPKYLNWHDSCICFINSISEVLPNDIISSLSC